MKKLLIFAFVVLALLNCGPKEEKLTGEPGGIMVIGTLEEPTALSPLRPSLTGSNEITDMLFLHLHRIDPKSGQIMNQLATSWEYSEDLKTLTYMLRKDVKWWDGKPVTAEDVLFAFNRMKNPKNGYPNVAGLRTIDKADLVDQYTIRFTFNKVYGDQLLDSDIPPVPRHILVNETNLEKFSTNPVGNGPYQIKAWTRGVSLELVANPAFYRGKPPLDQITILFYADIEAMAKDFEAGKLDMITGLTPTIAQRWQKNENIVINPQTGNSYLYVGWNFNNPVLKNLEVRKALAMSIDVPKMLKDLFLDQGAISVGPIPRSSWAYNSGVKSIVYNPVVAQDILAAQGFTDANRDKVLEKDGKPFELNIITNKENPLRVTIANQVAVDLGRIGIKAKVQTLDLNAFITSILTGKFDGYIMGCRLTQKIDPSIYWYSDPERGKYNLVAYKNASVDSLIDEGLVALSRKRAKAIWGRFQQIVYEAQPFTFLVIPNEISATYKRVRGVKEDGAKIVESFAYWIPEAERRPITVAAAPTPTPTPVPIPAPTPTPKGGTGTAVAAATPPPKAAIVDPEKILEERAKAAETTKAVEVAPPTAPKLPTITQVSVTKAVPAVYPAEVREFGVEGTVTIRVMIGVDGKVKEAAVTKSFGNTACEQAALKAARQWEFKPATKDGQPIESPMTLPFLFKP